MAAMRVAVLASMAAGSAAAVAPVEVVLARLEGDIDWLQGSGVSAPVTVYNAGAPMEAGDAKVVTIPNQGFEAQAYLHHIVHNWGSLAEKVVFIPSGKPTVGFQGFAHGVGHMLPGVELTDYMESPLFVPTMAVTPDLKQVSVRASYMEGKPEQEDARFSICSAEGAAGWSPFMPNTYATAVLEPLMEQNGQKAEVLTFQDFWRKHLAETSLPEVIRVAHSSVFSVLREDIVRRPKAFYQKLLADLQQPHQALFVENMWWYIFHGDDAICPDDFPSTTAVASNRRKLALALVVSPSSGDDISFGQVARIEWSSQYTDGAMPWRVEIWKYGTFITRIASPVYASFYEWLVSPDSAAKDWMSNSILSGTGTRTGVNLEPGDRYTIRICDASADDDQPTAEQICDDAYGESGEFDILPTVKMVEPSCIMEEFTPPSTIQAVWQSYYVDMSTVSISLHNSNDEVVFTEPSISNTGYYSFYAPYDMAAGMYRFKVSADCGGWCSNYWMTGETASIVGTGCWFTLAEVTTETPPSPPSLPGDAYEIPIIKAFEAGFNQYGAAAYSNNDGITYSSSDDSKKPCQEVCLAGYGRARKLLFGGLNAINFLTEEGLMPCTPRAQDCNCHFCPTR